MLAVIVPVINVVTTPENFQAANHGTLKPKPDRFGYGAKMERAPPGELHCPIVHLRRAKAARKAIPNFRNRYLSVERGRPRRAAARPAGHPMGVLNSPQNIFALVILLRCRFRAFKSLQ